LPKRADELSQIAHERSRAWREGKPGAILDIYVDIIPEDAFEEEQKKLAVLQRAMTKALGDEGAWMRTHYP
jgi:hypothetical protein